MRYAVIDIGSNTVKMNIYDVNPEKEEGAPLFNRILTESRSLGLINYVEKDRMNDDGIFKLVDTLSSFQQIVRNICCDNAFYFATASLRNISNTEEVIQIVTERTGVQIELISGENEALLSFSGLKCSFGDALRYGVMMDMGGGSTEVLGFIDGLAVRAVSLNFGCLSLYNRHVSGVFPKRSEYKAIKEEVAKKADMASWLRNYGDTAYLIGGTGRAIGKLYNSTVKNEHAGELCTMGVSEFRELYERFRKPGLEELGILVRAIPDRLHTILPGMAAYMKLFRRAGAQKIILSGTGIREGYLAERIK